MYKTMYESVLKMLLLLKCNSRQMPNSPIPWTGPVSVSLTLMKKTRLAILAFYRTILVLYTSFCVLLSLPELTWARYKLWVSNCNRYNNITLINMLNCFLYFSLFILFTINYACFRNENKHILIMKIIKWILWKPLML